MGTRLGHCLFIIFSEWICLFIITSILGGTKAEVRCVPLCHVPLLRAPPRELSDSGEAAAGQFVGFTEGSPGAGPTTGEEVAEFTASGETSSKVQQPSGGNNTNLRTDGEEKLSHLKVLPQTASLAAAPSPSNPKNSTYDATNTTFPGETGAQDEGEDVASWKQTRSARSAETLSGFRPDGGEEASDQVEFQLTSSTFALTGDTAHNQAMVHWSGQNSSVSINHIQIYACVF